MSNLFERAIVATDIHFGKKQNSRTHNIDCMKFIEWVCEQSEVLDADTFIFMGDWHDTRRFVNVSTMNYSLSALELLNKTFKKTYFILGNHDLYYREKREINSVEFGRNLENIVLINEILEVGNCAFVPWLVEDEWKKVVNIKAKYMFGHFELPNFLMNAMARMPDKGEIKAEDFTNQEYVFSGHFHKRQRQNNVWYIGNAFPHNFSDAWDDERGMMLLEWNKEPQFFAWPDQPLYKTFKLSNIIDSPDSELGPNVHARISLDLDLSFEEANFLKELFSNHFGAREITLVPAVKEDEEIEFDDNIEFQSIDQIVIEGLSGLESIESGSIDYQFLIEIYQLLTLDE